MEGEMSSPHRLIQPEGLAPGRGYTPVVEARPGTTVWVAGQIASGPDGEVIDAGWVAQFDQALANVVTALEAADAAPGHVVWMQVFTTDMAGYRRATGDLGVVWRRHMGSHYPAMALVAVTELVEPTALVEIAAAAVVAAE